jgi:hypothetical protein
VETKIREMPDQMPGTLARLDDPWGIIWRVKNSVKRFDLKRGLRFLKAYAGGVRYERPIFVLGIPRSGTTMLFYLLRASEELLSLTTEGQDVWRRHHHPRYSSWRSDAVGRGQVRLGERRYVNAYFYSFFNSDSKRFVDKTGENTLRVPYLDELFDDATFITIKRNPCDVINSLINGWRHPAGRYRAYYVPEKLNIPGYSHSRRWCFSLVEGWRDLTSSPIPEIAFAQWERYVKAIAETRATIAAERQHEVFFEDIIAEPDRSLAYICDALKIENTEALKNKLAELVASPVNALTMPEKNKWRRHNEAEITALLPRIAALAPTLGYRVDAVTGECEIIRDV